MGLLTREALPTECVEAGNGYYLQRVRSGPAKTRLAKTKAKAGRAPKPMVIPVVDLPAIKWRWRQKRPADCELQAALKY